MTPIEKCEVCHGIHEEYLCESCNHVESEHSEQDKGQCMLCDCEGIV